MWEVAKKGVVAHDAYATQLGLKGASGGTWAAHLAFVRAFGLVTATKTQIRLSPIGLDIVQDHDAERRQAARRRAFLSVQAYKDLLESYDGKALPEISKIASRLQFDFGKKPETAKEATDAFVESLKHVGLMDSENIVRQAGAGSAPPVVGEVAEVSPDEDEEDLEDLEEDELEWTDEAETPEELESFSGEQGARADAVSLHVTLDLSSYRADEVVEILSALGLARRRA